MHKLGPNRHESGFSLVELMVVIAILGVFMGLALPGFSRWLPGNRLRSAAKDLYSNLQHVKLLILTVVCTGLLLYSLSAFGMESDIKPYQPSAFMLIQNKTVHEIVASNKRFEVTRETQILDVNASLIKLHMLPVPCKAQIDYKQAAYGGLVVLGIKVKEVFASATTNWTGPSPDQRSYWTTVLIAISLITSSNGVMSKRYRGI